jgi:phosphomevalonate kinase
MRLTVPGNLLILGEYAVTEEGGLGLALAVDRMVVVESAPASRLIVEGSWGSGTFRWTTESADGSPLITAIVETWHEHLAERNSGKDPEGAHISVDSSAFFTSGRKSGFGSSAAVTVGLTCALLHHSGFRGRELFRHASRLALSAHRRAQGGKGSGYDVYASLYGGFGLFVGGREPSWQSLQLPWLPPLFLFHGSASVSTPNSITFYERWKRSNPRDLRKHLNDSNRSVQAFLDAENWAQGRRHFAALKNLGLRLGEQIGVSAAISAPRSLQPELCKALGAGNELAIYIAETPPDDPAVEPVTVSAGGVQWHT